MQIIRILVCLSPCVYPTPVSLLKWVPTLIRVSIRPLVLVVLTRVLTTGELFEAWHSARPTVSIPGLVVVRLRKCRISAENELHGRRSSMLARCTVLSMPGVSVSLPPRTNVWPAPGMKVGLDRLLWPSLMNV